MTRTIYTGVSVDTNTDWGKTAELLIALDQIGRQGAVVVIKIDGEREVDRFTVIVSGGRLGANVFRRDGDVLTEIIEMALGFYRDREADDPPSCDAPRLE